MKKIIIIIISILILNNFLACTKKLSYKEAKNYYLKKGYISQFLLDRINIYNNKVKLTQYDIDHFKDLQLTCIVMQNYTNLNKFDWSVIPKLINVDCFVFTQSKINDKMLKYISKLRKIEGLLINSTPITDKGLSYLKGLENLKRLEIGGCSDITDEGMKYVGQLKNLEWLNIANTHITDKGIMYLKNPKLDTIIASYNEGLTDKSFEYIIHNFKLKVLELEETPNISEKKKDDFWNNRNGIEYYY